MGKIGHHAKAIVFAKNGQFRSKMKILKKHAKNDSTNTLELFCAKNGLKKHLIFEKWPFLENGQNWPPGNGYIVFGRNSQFGSKIKILKNMRKTTLQTH